MLWGWILTHSRYTDGAPWYTDCLREVDLEIRRVSETVTRLSTVVDPADAGALRKLLGDAVRRDGRGASALGDYEMVVRYSGERGVVATFVATSKRSAGRRHGCRTSTGPR